MSQRSRGLVGRHRRELLVRCYRMLGSFEDVEDTVQETFLRASRRQGAVAAAVLAGMLRATTSTARCRPQGVQLRGSGASAHRPHFRQPAARHPLLPLAGAVGHTYLPLTIDVLRITGGAITEIITFHDDQFSRLGMPEHLPADAAE